MAALSIKITFNGDTRKITTLPAQLFSTIATRFEIDSPDRIQLQFNNQVVDLDQLVTLAAVKPRTLKVTMTLRPPPHECARPQPQNCASEPASPEMVQTPDEPKWNGWTKREWKDWKKGCKYNPDSHNHEWTEGHNDEWTEDWADKNDETEWAENDSSAEWKEGWSEKQDGHQSLKQKAVETKQQAKKLALQAKQEAKTAKEAYKSFHRADKTAQKAAHKASMQAQKAEKKIKSANDQSIQGKLVNWNQGDPATCHGELTILNCGRVCFHHDHHRGNLRVNKALEVQKCGGKGLAAQLLAQPTKDKPSVFRLASNAFPENFVGVSHSQTDVSLKSTTATYAFTIVDRDSPAGLWSFWPEGSSSPIELEQPAPVPKARNVYESLQDTVRQIADNTGIQIEMADAPEDEAALAQMLNSLHDFLPHGLKRIAMKKTGLRQFEIPVVKEEHTEFESLLAELLEMGFDNPKENLTAVEAADGDLKLAVRRLVKGMRN